MYLVLTVFSLHLFLVTVALAEGKQRIHSDIQVLHYDFNIQYAYQVNQEHFNPDCSNYTDPLTLLVNGQLPGPTITATKGQRVRVLVRNQLTSSTEAESNVTQYDRSNTNMVTIHYHGIRQYGSNQADGVPFLTQDPIPPGGQFLYDFVMDASGTYFYHAHVGLQEHSVFGGIIVYESERVDPAHDKKIDEPHQQEKQLTLEGINDSQDIIYHDERTILLSEWFHRDRTELEAYFLGPAFTGIPDAESILINGRTIHNQSTIISTTNARCRGFTVIHVEKGRRYRFRIIGAMTFRTLGFAIAGHQLTIIEADGSLVEPYSTDYLEVSPGQRYSVLVTADQSIRDYNIGTTRLWASGVNPTSNGWAILRYKSGDSTDNSDATSLSLPSQELPNLPLQSVPLWIWDKLKPFGGQADTVAMLPRANRTIYLHTTSGPLPTLPGATRFFVNGVTYNQPSTTILSEILSGSRVQSPLTTRELGRSDRRGYDPYLGTYPLEHMEVVDFVIQNTRSAGTPCRSHPWHTHGHSHYHIASSGGTYNEKLHGSLRNIPFPMLKDTTLVYPDLDQPPLESPSSNTSTIGCGWSRIRLTADNPGIWAVHCHNIIHMNMGMMIILEESANMIPNFLQKN